MSKILDLKRWLTLSEAARYLSKAFKEEVSVADILYLCLDRRLTLSIDIMGGADARAGTVMAKDDAPKIAFPLAQGGELTMGISLNNGTMMVLDEDVVQLRGIFDLPFIGGERNEIERLYQEMIGGPDVDLISLDGSFVQGKNGEYFQLQMSYDHNEYVAGSSANGEALKKKIVSDGIPPEEASMMLDAYQAKRLQFLEERKSYTGSKGFHPTSSLPLGSALVIRSDALREFQCSLDEESAEPKSLSTTERNTLLKLLIGMAIGGYGYDPKAAKSSTPSQVEADITKCGMKVSDDTVRKYLDIAVNQVLPRT